jgi:hypothetical protein
MEPMGVLDDAEGVAEAEQVDVREGAVYGRFGGHEASACRLTASTPSR